MFSPGTGTCFIGQIKQTQNISNSAYVCLSPEKEESRQNDITQDKTYKFTGHEAVTRKMTH